MSLKKRWIELFDQGKEQEEEKAEEEKAEEDTRSCEEITKEIFKRMRKEQ